jgi:hypothetical protein
MFRGAILAGGLALVATSLVSAQEPRTPPVPEDALAPRELIAWSSLQTPQPAQQTLPPIQNQAREANQDSAHGPQQSAGVQAQQARAHNPAQSPTPDSHTPTPTR